MTDAEDYMMDTRKQEKVDEATAMAQQTNELCNFNSILSILSAGKGRQLANDLIDDLLKSIGPKVKLVGLDPLKLPERSVEFEKQVCCKTYPGVAELKQGVCRGLSDARRHGEISLNIGENIEIAFVVRLGPLSATYESDVTLRDHLFHPRLTATAEYMDILIDMVLNTKAMTLDMRNLKISEVAPVAVTVEKMCFCTRFLVKPVVQHLINSEAKFFIAKVNVDFKEHVKELASNSMNIKRWIPSIFQ